MVSSYTTNKAFEKPANGDYVDTWNIPVNGDWDIADRAFGGTYSVSLTNTNVTLTQNNAQNVRIRLTGSLSASVVVYFPAGVSGFYIVQNATTGTYNVTLASAGSSPGTTVLTEQGRTAFIFTDGSNVFYADDARVQLSAGTGISITGTTNLTIALQTPVAVANGGTGVTSSTGTGSVVLSASPALTGVPTAPTAAAGTSTTQIATTAFVAGTVTSTVPTGVIVLWSGAANAIPAGWQLCDGTNSTPDLRDRFVVGAGASYGVGATGGANSITLDTTQIPAHTHGFSATTGGMNSNASHSHSISDPGHAHNYYAGSAGVGSSPYSSSFSFSSNGVFTTSASGTGIGINATNIDHTHSVNGTSGSTGGGLSHENRPPYYALCYIMKT